MFGFKREVALPKESQGVPRSVRFCRCGTKISFCRQCGVPYCPQCDGSHLFKWDERTAPVFICQQQGRW